MPIVLCAAKAVIVHEGRFLAIKQTVNGKVFWDLPGGKLEYGESPLAAIEREVKEETCLSIEVGRILGAWWFFRESDGNQVVCLTYLCTKKPGEVCLTKNPATENIIESRWVTQKEFLKKEYTVSHESLKKLISEMMI